MIETDKFKILRCNRKRHCEGLACYIRNDLNWDMVSLFPREIENIFSEILLPDFKLVTIATIYRPPDQSNF